MTSAPTPEQIAEIQKRDAEAHEDIHNNFGAAYSSRISQDSYSIHKDRATLLRAVQALTDRLAEAEAEGASLQTDVLSIADTLQAKSADYSMVASEFMLEMSAAIKEHNAGRHLRASALLTELAADKQTIVDRTVERDKLERVSVKAIEYAQELEDKITKLEASQLPEGCAAATQATTQVQEGGK